MQTTVQKLLNNGYHIVPINHGTKGPRIKNWQNTDFGAADIKAGVGVKTGIGQSPICAIDIDVLDADLAAKFSSYCQDKYGATVERVGQAPKTMLIYKAADAGWRKATSVWFEDDQGTRQRLEVLGAGQQFVAYHIHPDTNKPYEWIDFFGGLESLPAAELPELTTADVQDLIRVFEEMAKLAGLKPDAPTKTSSISRSTTVDADDFTAGLVTVGIEIAEANKLLVNLDPTDYDLWLNMGMALHHEFEGSRDAFDVWLEWSKKAENFVSEEDLLKRWSGFESGAGGVTARSLIKLGNEANRQAATANKQSLSNEAIQVIESSTDVFTLTDITLPSIGKQLAKDDVVLIKIISDAAIKKAKSFGVDLTRTDITTKFGFKVEPVQGGGETVETKKDRTEIGNAKRMVLDNQDKILYEMKTDSWYQFNGNVWKRVTAIDIEAAAKKTIETLADEFLDLGIMDKKEHFAYVQKSFTAKMVSSMVRLAKSEDSVRVNIEDLDADKSLFTVANGMIDLKTGKLLPPDPRKHMTISSPVKYDPDAQCPVFMETVRDIFSGSEEMVQFMARWFGYQMLGDPKENKIGIPFGCGANGKSTLFNIVRDVFGEHAKTAESSTFLGNGSQNGGGPREDILRLQGARMVNVTEPSENSVLKEALIKSMTGGEAMPARAAYGKHTVEVMPTWVTNMPTNHKPIIKGDDHGIWRRLMLIPFDRNFDQDPSVKKDIHRSDKLKAELPGILNWLIAGCLEYQKIGLNPPREVVEATASYKGEMNILGEFLDERCERGSGYVCTVVELWEAWKGYAEERGELSYIPSARSLGRRMANQGVELIRSTHGIRGRGYKGIRVRSVFEDDRD